MTRTVQLGGETFEASPIPLGRLRKLLPAFNRAGIAFAGGTIDEKAFTDLFDVLHHGLGIPHDKLESLPATMPELIAALQTVADVAGLRAAPEDGEGNAAATDSSGMTSTLT